MNNSCVLCEEEILVHNDTKEHIIPNAIGGKKKVSGFICNDCNNKSGSVWEVELAKQLNPLSLLFDVNRERGKAPSQIFETTSGNKIKLHNDGKMEMPKPIYKEESSDKGVKVQIRARNIKEAEGMLKGVKRKYPNINIDHELKSETIYTTEPINIPLSFGGHETGRSIVKSALAVVYDSGVDPMSCKLGLAYLRDEGVEPCFGYFYAFDPIKNRPVGIPLHCVYVKGDAKEKLIIGYVEFFGYQRLALCLSNNYVGESFEGSYSINPLDGRELLLNFDFTLNSQQIKECYEYKLIPDGSIQKALGAVMETAIKNDYEREKKSVIEEAVTYGFENCDAKYGEDLTNEQQNKMSALVQEKMLPFLLNQIQR